MIDFFLGTLFGAAATFGSLLLSLRLVRTAGAPTAVMYQDDETEARVEQRLKVANEQFLAQPFDEIPGLGR